MYVCMYIYILSFHRCVFFKDGRGHERLELEYSISSFSMQKLTATDPFAILVLTNTYAARLRCRSAHVIVNVAGPYMLTQGELLLDCCCRCGTDYCDVSGEIPW